MAIADDICRNNRLFTKLRRLKVTPIHLAGCLQRMGIDEVRNKSLVPGSTTSIGIPTRLSAVAAGSVTVKRSTPIGSSKTSFACSSTVTMAPVDYSENMKLTEKLGQLVCPI